MDELIREFLSSAVIVVILTGASQLVLRLVDNKAKRRELAESTRSAKAIADESDDDARRAREYEAFEATQAAYGLHVTWDFEVLNELAFRTRLLHQSQTRAGETPTPFAPFRQPPPLRPPPRVLPPPT